MGFFGLSWGGNSKLPSVQVERDGSEVLYKLTDHDAGQFKSCITGAYSNRTMINLAFAIPEVFSPINEIASRVAGATYQLRSIKTDEIIYDNKFVNRLMDRPNFQMNWFQFMWMSTFYHIACGNDFTYTKVPDGLKRTLENTSALWTLPPDETDPHVRPNRVPILTATSYQDIFDYYQTTLCGDRERIPAELVEYTTFISLMRNDADPLKGVSPLLADDKPMSNLVAVYLARGTIYFKRGQLGMWVSQKQDESGTVSLTPREKKDARDDMNTDYGLMGGKQDPIGITSVPLDFVRSSMSIEELQPFEETYASAAAIYGTLGVPRSFIPTKDGPTYTNGPADERKFYNDVIFRVAAQRAAVVGRALGLTDRGLYLKADFSHVDVLQDDKKAKAETDEVTTRTKMVQYEKGFITKNQVRVAIGEEEVPGDDVYVADASNNASFAEKFEVGKVTAMKELIASGLPPITIKNNLMAIYGADDATANMMIEGLTEKVNTPNNGIPAPQN